MERVHSMHRVLPCRLVPLVNSPRPSSRRHVPVVDTTRTMFHGKPPRVNHELLDPAVAPLRSSIVLVCPAGPDEYTAIVDNNFYTNIMAQMNLQYAHELYRILDTEHAEELQRIKTTIGMQVVSRWGMRGW